MNSFQGPLIFCRTTRANFRLVFLGDVSDIRDEVRRVIVEKADRTEGTDYKVLLVDKFIIDISSKFPDGYSTPKPPPAGTTFNPAKCTLQSWSNE